MAEAEQGGATDLDTRYGRTPSSRRKTVWVVAASAVGFAAVFVAWLVWGGLLEPPSQLEVIDTQHEVLSDSEVSVTWQVNVQPGTDVRCAVQALDSRFAIVGWKVVELPASEQRTREYTDTVRTTELAVTGLIYRCWLA